MNTTTKHRIMVIGTAVLLFAIAIFLFSGCSIQSPTCLNKEQSRYQAQDNHGSRRANCLTPEAKRYQIERR